MNIDSSEIIAIFSQLNLCSEQYLLIRNINNELPNNLTIGKDIDILINKKNKFLFSNFLHERGFKSVKHPLFNDIFLYGVDKFEFKINSKNNIILDLNFQLVCRSFNAGEWIPLDQTIQESAWENRIFIEHESGLSYWTLGHEDEFVSLLVRSVFDKKYFLEGYVTRIEELLGLIDIAIVQSKLDLVFFKFTSVLLNLIEKKDYSNIIGEYVKFKDY
jgi:hypothetical protein